MPLAVIAGILAPGLGYLYVGRLQLALMTLPAMILIVAIAGWTRLIIEPAGFYVTYLSIITIWLISVVHPAIVANGSGQLATKAYNRGWFYVAWLLVVTVIAIGYPGLRAPLFGFEPFRIPANSMAPTILRNDYVMADTWHFEQSEPGINDLIVYEMPDNPDIHYMKRIVGLPGDTIEIRPVGILAHSFDHRAFDGAYSAAFLRRLKTIIEDTDWSKEL